MKRRSKVVITKASGEEAIFSNEKLKRSLIHAGATKQLAETIAEEIRPRLHAGISTKKIYQFAFNMLRERSAHLAAKYHLKRGIMELGPSGYPFERFISEILRHKGYAVRVGEIVQGKCVNHEIDVIAEQDHHHFMIECKYHNRPGTITDVKIPLYVQARFKDVEATWVKLAGHASKFHQGWVVTNTRFTRDAIQYGTCAGLFLLGWNFPKQGSLKELIDNSGLYPLTCLTTLTKTEKAGLLGKGIVLCKDIVENEKYLAEVITKANRMNLIVEEARQLCNTMEIPGK